MTDRPTTPEIIEQMIDPKFLTYDEFMRRNPKTLTDEEVLQGILAARRDRALYIKGQEAKRMKKAGLPETETEEEDDNGNE